MAKEKKAFRDVKGEHLEKLFGGPIVAVHDTGDSCIIIQTEKDTFGMTETETALLRALTDLDVQRNKDIAAIIKSYELKLAKRGTKRVKC
jgi:hypothetical protein